MSYQWLEAQSPSIIYIGDPMCSWCYGFAPEVSKVKDAFPDYDFRLILGGLRPGGKETNKELGAFLDHHWKDVEKRTKQPFNYDILKDETLVYDTEPACRAVVVARSMKPELELEFFKSVQSLFYVDGKNMRVADSYLGLAKEYGLDESKFVELFESDEMKKQTMADFQLSASMGIRGFPSMVFRYGGQYYLIANGYQVSESLISTIQEITSSK